MPDRRAADFGTFFSGYKGRSRLLSHTALATTIMLGGVLAGSALAADMTGANGSVGFNVISVGYGPETITTEGAGITVIRITGSATGDNGGAGGPGTGTAAVNPGESSNGTGGAGGLGRNGTSGSIGALDIILNEDVENPLNVTLTTGVATGGNGAAGGEGKGGTGGIGGTGGTSGDGTGGAGGPGGSANGMGGAGGMGGVATGGGIDAVTIDVTGDIMSGATLNITGGAATGGTGGTGGAGTGGTGGAGGTGANSFGSLGLVGGAGGPGGSADGRGGAGGAGGNAVGGGIGGVTIDVTGNVISATTLELTGGSATGGPAGKGGDGQGGTGGAGGIGGKGGGPDGAGGTGGAGGSANGTGGAGGAGGGATGGGIGVVTIDVTGNIISATTLQLIGGNATGGDGGAGGNGTGGTGGSAGIGGSGGTAVDDGGPGGAGGSGGSADGIGGAGGAGGSAAGGAIGAVMIDVTGDITSTTELDIAGGDATGGNGGAGGDGTGGTGGNGGTGGFGFGSPGGPSTGGAGGVGGTAVGTGGAGGVGGAATGGDVGAVMISVTGNIASATSLTIKGGLAEGGDGGSGGKGQGGIGGAGGTGGVGSGFNTGGNGGGGGWADGWGGAGGAGGAAIGGDIDAVTVDVTGDITSATMLQLTGGNATGGKGGAGGEGKGGTGGNGGNGGDDVIDGDGGRGGFARGVGGAGGAGGDATGGDANVTMTSSGTITLTGADAIAITVEAGNATGGEGGAGGAGTGGTAGTGGAGRLPSLDGRADGAGGNGGAGGFATGGDAHVTLNNSSAITVTGGNAITIVAAAGDATGGDGGAAGSSTGGIAFGVTGGAGGGAQGGIAEVRVTNDGEIRATGNGIDITATAGTGTGGTGGTGDAAGLDGAGSNGSSSITVGNSGVVDVDGIGVKALAKGDNGTIQINNTGGTITGGAGGVVVATDLGFVGNSDIDIVNSGLITSGNLLTAAAIDAKGASAELRNSGTVLGYVDLTEEGDTVDNEAGGVFAARAASNFRGGHDIFNNSGTVAAAADAMMTETVQLWDLEEFNNFGLITMVDGAAGDELRMSGNTQYDSNGGRLAVDAFLAEGAAGRSDRLTIFGDSSGTTLVSVNVTGVAGANTDGITVVAVDGISHEGDFVLDGGTLNVGLFTWDMRQDGGTFELFTSGVGTGAHEFPAGITGMQDIWYQTTGTLLQRQADLRPLLTGTQVTPVADFSEPVAPTPAGQIGPGFWMKGVGAWLERDQDNDTDRKQSIYGGLAGFDFATEGAGDAWLFGLYGGYLGSKLKFNETDTEWTYNGPTVGAYATYLNEALYVDMLVKADFLSINIDPDDVAPDADDEDTDGVNVGGMIDAGYKFGGDEGVFLEPQATLAVLHTQIDDVDMYGGTVKFDDETSVRGRLGLRLGYDHTAANAVVYSSDVTAGVWQEFNDGSNDVSIVTADFPAFGVSDEPGETVGDISLGFSVVAPEGWSGFLRGNYQFSDDLDAIAGSAGLRYSW